MQECPLEKNNYIDHTLFTKSSEDCRKISLNISVTFFIFKHEILPTGGNARTWEAAGSTTGTPFTTRRPQTIAISLGIY